MKFKFYTIAMVLSMFCTGNVWGNRSCPTIPESWDGKSGLEGWTLAKNKNPETAAKDLTFQNAWIYDLGNDPAKCHYNIKGVGSAVVSFNRPNTEINSDTYYFEGVARNDKHPGYHCKGPTIKDCVFREGSSKK